MGLLGIFAVSGSGMAAQSVRLNTTASNLANADSAASSPEKAYRSLQPVFESLDIADGFSFDSSGKSVQVSEITRSMAPIRTEYRPDHPLADAKGQVYFSNVNTVEEMTNMIAASRAYQTNADVLNSAKELMLKTLSLLAI